MRNHFLIEIDLFFEKEKRNFIMNLKYQTTFEDYMALQKDSLKKTSYHQSRSKITYLALSGIVFFINLIIFNILVPVFFDFLSDNLITLIIFCAAIIPVLLMRPILLKYYSFVTIQQLKSSLKHEKKWPRDIVLQFHENGIQVHSSYFGVDKEIEVAWESIKVVGEDNDHFFLYYETNEAIIVPKNTPSLTESENTYLSDLIKQHLKT